MFQGLSEVFLYVLFCGIGLSFLSFFITIFRIMLCHRRPLSFPERTESEAEAGRGRNGSIGDREMSTTHNVLRPTNEIRADSVVDENSNSNHTHV